MALSFQDTNGLLVIPGGYASWDVAPSAGGTSATGIMVLMGEAANGPSYADEDIVAVGGFGVNSKASVVSKFGSGPLVDAYIMATAPSKDPAVKGSPTRIHLVKTNQGSKAELSSAGYYNYAKLVAKTQGTDGNLIKIVTTVNSNDADKIDIEVSRKKDGVLETYTGIGNNPAFDIGALTRATCEVSIDATTMSSLGAKAIVTVTMTDPAVLGNTLTINGHTVTCAAADDAPNGKFAAGSWGAAGVTAAINATIPTVHATFSDTTHIITIEAVAAGVAGNSFGISTNAAGVFAIAGGATHLSGGVDPFTATLADFSTLGDLASWVDSKEGWSAEAVAAFTQLTPSALDLGDFDVHDSTGTTPIGLKKDAYDFVKAISSSKLIEVGTAPTVGLPAVASPADSTNTLFFSGGVKGPTLAADITDALTQIERLTCNFVIPCFSQDADPDIAAGLTDSGSTYQIASINAALSTHVSKMSQFKNRKPRQGFGSLIDTFVNQKKAAQKMANARMTIAFQEVMTAGANGSLGWFQPWAGAVTAAAMQAAGFRQPIFNKAVNLYGTRSPSGDFIVEDTGYVEDAILAGLLTIAARPSDGATCFVSDQTTYGKDANFVYNSVQAIYVSDTISQTFAQRFEAAFVGVNFADISAGAAMSFFKSIAAELRRLKLLASSDDAPAGYKNAVINIQPPAMLVSAELKPSTGIYFVPLNFLMTQSTQTATA